MFTNLLGNEYSRKSDRSPDCYRELPFIHDYPLSCIDICYYDLEWDECVTEGFSFE